MRSQLAKGRFFGHPVHPMLVHFPTALFVSGSLFDIIGCFYPGHSLFRTSLYCLSAGVLLGSIAVIFGALDYIQLATGIASSFRKATWHGGMQFVVLMTFTVAVGIRWKSYPASITPDGFLVIAEGVAVVVMLVANYLGGDLVYRDGVGVKETVTQKD